MRPRPVSRWLRGALCVTGLLLGASCVVGPQPEPPVIDVSQLSFGSEGAKVTLVGGPGAVKPGGSDLSTVDLDTTAPEARVAVAKDGSFSLTLGGPVSDEYRLQATSIGLRSTPLDVTGAQSIVGDTLVALVMPPGAGCFALAPRLELGPLAPSSSTTVTMTNDCTSDVTVSGFSLRLDSPAFTVAPSTGPIVVPAGGKGSFTVTFTPHIGDPLEDVLFVNVGVPKAGRLALTLRGQTP